MRRIALITNDTVGEQMAGPGIRYWEFARILGQRFHVKLIVPPFVPMETEIRTERFPASVRVCRNSRDLRDAVQDCDVIITRGVVLTAYGFLLGLGKALVLDMYSPVLLEGIQREVDSDLLEKISSYENDLDALKQQLRAGDFFICADERQRDYWLGMLSAVGRVNPYTHGQDATLRQLLGLVPFGLPETPPRHTRAVLKGVYKTISSDDKVILWGGGIWNWLDAPTLIRAMSLVLRQRTDVKVFFMGVKRPNPNIARMKAVDEAINLSRDIGLFDTHVFFNDWVPYAERGDYLLEADIGVSLHLDHVETRFAFRTRLLDYVWAGLPILATGGDVLGEMLAQENLARIVSPQDVDGVARAILTLLSCPTLRADCAPGFRRVGERYGWEKVIEPLVGFCAEPYIAPDKPYLAQNVSFFETRGTSRNLATKSLRALRLGGVRGLYRQVEAYVSWRMRK